MCIYKRNPKDTPEYKWLMERYENYSIVGLRRTVENEDDPLRRLVDAMYKFIDEVEPREWCIGDILENHYEGYFEDDYDFGRFYLNGLIKREKEAEGYDLADFVYEAFEHIDWASYSEYAISADYVNYNGHVFCYSNLF